MMESSVVIKNPAIKTKPPLPTNSGEALSSATMSKPTIITDGVGVVMNLEKIN